MSDIESDLFAINLDDTEAGASATATDPTPAADRTGQTEEEFQAVRKAYRVKVEDGDVSSSIVGFFGGTRAPRRYNNPRAPAHCPDRG